MRLAMKNSKFNLMEKFRMFKNTVLLLLLLVSCRNQSQNISSSTSLPIITGAQQIEVYLPILKDKNIGIVANQTSIVTNENGNHIHLVDTLLGHQINIVKCMLLNTDLGDCRRWRTYKGWEGQPNRSPYYIFIWK